MFFLPLKFEKGKNADLLFEGNERGDCGGVGNNALELFVFVFGFIMVVVCDDCCGVVEREREKEEDNEFGFEEPKIAVFDPNDEGFEPFVIFAGIACCFGNSVNF